MKKPVDQALVDQYLHKIQVQAVKAAAQTDVAHDIVKQIIAEAESQFDLVAKNGETPKEAFSKAFKNVLILTAQRTHESQPKQKAVFEYAASLITL